jgi:hypothetical protein
LLSEIVPGLDLAPAAPNGIAGIAETANVITAIVRNNIFANLVETFHAFIMSPLQCCIHCNFPGHFASLPAH